MSKIKMNKTGIQNIINYVSSSDFSQSKKATINKCLDKQLPAFDSFLQDSYKDRTMDYIVCPDCNNRKYPTRYCSKCGIWLFKGVW